MQTKMAQRITRLKLGTNTLHALLVNDHPVVTVTPDGLSIDPRFGARLSKTVIGDTAYILGSVTLNGVEIVIDANSIAIGGVGTLVGLRVSELRIQIDDEARVHVEVT